MQGRVGPVVDTECDACEGVGRPECACCRGVGRVRTVVQPFVLLNALAHQADSVANQRLRHVMLRTVHELYTQLRVLLPEEYERTRKP